MSEFADPHAAWVRASGDALIIDGLNARVANLEVALEELLDAVEGVACYPEGAVGFESLSEAETKARDVLGRRGSQ